MACCNNCTPIRIKDKVCQICDFLSTNDCTGGIGATYAIRQLINNNDNTWTIDGAPDHITTGFDTGVIFAAAGGPYTPAGSPYQVSNNVFDLVNPSTCRDMRFLFIATSNALFGFDAALGPHDMNFNIELQDAGTAALLGVGLMQNEAGNNTQAGGSITAHIIVTVPPSGTRSIRVVNNLQMSAGSGNSFLHWTQYVVQGNTV